MTKKLMIGSVVAVIVLTLLISSVAFAQERDATLENLYDQIYELRRQIVERRAELGHLSEEEGLEILTRMEERYQNGPEEGYGRFFGMWGRDRDDGWSRGSKGFGHCWR